MLKPEPIFTAKRPRSALRHGWWALPLMAVLILVLLRPWDAATPKSFKLRPATTPASAPAQAVGVEVRIIPASPAASH